MIHVNLTRKYVTVDHRLSSEKGRKSEEPVQHGLREAALVSEYATLIFQNPLKVCRNWHHSVLAAWLPRFHRADPSTSLDEYFSSSVIQFAEMIAQAKPQVKPKPVAGECTPGEFKPSPINTKAIRLFPFYVAGQDFATITRVPNELYRYRPRQEQGACPWPGKPD